MEPTTSPHYVLVMDQRRNFLLGAMYDAVCNSIEAKYRFNAMCAGFGLTTEEIRAFIDEWADKEHALNWCDDPNCKRPEGKTS